MTQQEENRLNNKLTSIIAGFSNAIIDSIVHDKIQEFINQMGSFFQSPYEEESVNDKHFSRNISTTSPQQQVLIQSQ